MKTYTIKELADRFSVTEMAIHKQLKHDKLKDFIIYENNRKFLTEKGLNALTTLRNDNQKYSSKSKDKDNVDTEKATKEIKTTNEKTANDNSQTSAYSSDSNTFGTESILYKQLCKQLEIKDSQISELTSLLGKQTDQVNLLTHTIKHMNGTLQLREVSSITSDINDINDINIKDIESDILNKFGSAYKTSYNQSYYNVAASNTEVESEPDVKTTNSIDDVIQKAKEDLQNIQGVVDEPVTVKDTPNPIEDAVTLDNSNIETNDTDSDDNEENDDSGEIIFSVKEKNDESEPVEETHKKGFFGKLFGKK